MTRQPTPSRIPAERITEYDQLIATLPGVNRKGATIPYTSLNGHMFSYLAEAGTLVLRLPPADREAFVRRHSTKLHEAYGIVQKEYVEVPDALFGDDLLARYFCASHTYVAAMKPKATTRRKPSGA